MGYGQVNVGGKSKLNEESYSDIRLQSGSGKNEFRVTTTTNHKIIGLKTCDAKTNWSGGSINNIHYEFSGNTITVTGTKIHTYDYTIILNFTILY